MTKSKLDHALELAALGFYVFPIVAGKKSPPAMKDWQSAATRDPEWIRHMWHSADFNIGISTSKFGDGQALLVVDVDNKGEKRGDHEILRLELAGADLPATREHTTPTGGRHLLYVVDGAVRQGANTLGPGIDIRSRGGYVVGPGSTVGEGVYGVAVGSELHRAPAWLVDRCGKPRERVNRQDQPAPDGVNAAAAVERARHYLLHEAPAGVAGGRNDTAYKVAARCKDMGCDLPTTLLLMLNEWKCEPALESDELSHVVNSAYSYGKDPVGVSAPEAVFPPVEAHQPKADATPQAVHPFDELNREFAFTIAGGGSHILWETRDHTGRAILQHLDIGTFNRKFASRKMNLGKRDEKVTELWMESPKRRSYDGLVFAPGVDCPANFYNLWRGFAYEPAPAYEPHPAVEAWLEHARDNVCRADDALFRWLVAYFAHLVQRPWEKPLVALVLRGGKGVGKNALVERVGALLGGHFLLTSNRRYLVGNFNGHMENLLLFALDEAFWSGDKQAEGQLKDLITGAKHVIEHKGKEPYEVENRTRIAIIGNEEWMVPSTHDERRFAVFDVGPGRQQDRAYFTDMRRGMEDGGYPLFLRYLLNFDASGVDINDAPQTEALLDQKHASLGLVEKWWLDCLSGGRIVAGDFEHAFGAHAECERFRGAFRRYAKEIGRAAYLPDERTFGRLLKKVCPLIVPSKERQSGGLVNTYKLPGLTEARAAWDQFIGHKVAWPD